MQYHHHYHQHQHHPLNLLSSIMVGHWIKTFFPSWILAAGYPLVPFFVFCLFHSIPFHSLYSIRFWIGQRNLMVRKFLCVCVLVCACAAFFSTKMDHKSVLNQYQHRSIYSLLSLSLSSLVRNEGKLRQMELKIFPSSFSITHCPSNSFPIEIQTHTHTHAHPLTNTHPHAHTTGIYSFEQNSIGLEYSPIFSNILFSFLILLFF